MAKAKKNTIKKDEIPLILLTNDRTPFKGAMLETIYKATALAQLGYMDGLDPETGDIIPLLVGLQPTENDTQFKVYPLARILQKDEIKFYLVPDGTGSYIDYRNTEQREPELAALPEEEGPAS
jgi:hypothetical protein